MPIRNTGIHDVYDETGVAYQIAEFRTFAKYTDLGRGQREEAAGTPTFSVRVDGIERSVIDMNGSDDYDCPPRTVFKDETGKIYLLARACT